MWARRFERWREGVTRDPPRRIGARAIEIRGAAVAYRAHVKRGTSLRRHMRRCGHTKRDPSAASRARKLRGKNKFARDSGRDDGGRVGTDGGAAVGSAKAHDDERGRFRPALKSSAGLPRINPGASTQRQRLNQNKNKTKPAGLESESALPAADRRYKGKSA